MLDTGAGSDVDRLHRACGWTAAGTVPSFALTTNGRPAGATVFYRSPAS